MRTVNHIGILLQRKFSFLFMSPKSAFIEKKVTHEVPWSILISIFYPSSSQLDEAIINLRDEFSLTATVVLVL